MKRKHLVGLLLCLAVSTFALAPMRVVNAGAPEGWRNLPDFYVFKDKVSGWAGSGAGELETVNGNLPVDTEVTYDNLPSLRLNVKTQVTSWWWSANFTLRDWAPIDVARYVPNGYLEFNVKGQKGGEQFVVGVTDNVAERPTGDKTITKATTNYCKITTEWQHVRIPLKDILDPSLGIDPSNARMFVLDKVDTNPFCVWINQIKFTSPDQEKSYPAIKLNQVGFPVLAEKYALVTGFEDELKAAAGTPFQVRQVSSGQVVYGGRLVLVKDYDANDSGEKVFKAVFSCLIKPGDYYITVDAPGIEKSPRFKIGHNVYQPLLTDAARYFYYQRSGIDLTEKYCPDYPRKDRTPQDTAAILESNPTVTRDVSQGWFDAGDLGKYVSTGAGTLSNLFWSFELFPWVYKDNQFNIPESGNGVPDILDEARWELDWILKMQEEASGGFYAQVQSDDDGKITKRIIKDKEGNNANVKPTDSTACAAAVLAQAALLYAKYDVAFAQKCLKAAKSAWLYLEQHPDNIKATGPYSVDTDLSDRFWAAAALYRATGEPKYNFYFLANYSKAKEYYENKLGDGSGLGNNWANGFFCYLKAKNPNCYVKRWFDNEFSIWVNNKIERYKTNPWGNIIANGNYYWGSNSIVLGVCQEAVIGSRLLGLNPEATNRMALSALNWILGANPMRKSFVSGYGDDCIKTIFSTFNNDGKTGIAKGFMPGGPNRYQGAGISLFPAKCYMDSAWEWTTNEHTTGWNSILVFMTAFANSMF